MKAPHFPDPIAWEATLPVRPSSSTWRVVIKSLYGTPLEPEELALFHELSGNREPPERGADELLVVAGRRGGKSETIARLATFEALHGGHAIALAPGQTGLIPVISPLREQSQEILGYVRGLAALPQVKRFVDGEPTRDGVVFKTGIAIRVMTADAVNVSGPTVVTAIRDEWAKWPGAESNMPDTEIENSLRPALAPVAGAPRRRLIGITSAYIREGLAYSTECEHFGQPDAPVLVVRGPTERFNPNVDRAWLERERRRVGERVFAREYLAEWQDAVTECWFGADVIEQCIDRGRQRSGPIESVEYLAAIDPAWRGDLFALAIAHREAPTDRPARVVVDGVWTWKASGGAPLSVEDTVAESADILHEYGIQDALADQFGFDPLRESYARHGIYLVQQAWTASSKPARFGRVRAAMTSSLVRLPDDSALVREFHGIQGKLLRSGGEQIEARGSGHDDRVHAVVMVAAETMEQHPDDTKRSRTAPVEQVDPNEARGREWEQRIEARIERDRRRNDMLFGLEPPDFHVRSPFARFDDE